MLSIPPLKWWAIVGRPYRDLGRHPSKSTECSRSATHFGVWVSHVHPTSDLARHLHIGDLIGDSSRSFQGQRHVFAVDDATHLQLSRDPVVFHIQHHRFLVHRERRQQRFPFATVMREGDPAIRRCFASVRRATTIRERHCQADRRWPVDARLAASARRSRPLVPPAEDSSSLRFPS
jgi:hypothetical protein